MWLVKKQIIKYSRLWRNKLISKLPYLAHTVVEFNKRFKTKF